MTTAGYGDMFAITGLGRFFSVLSFIIGNLLISICIITLA
jgi:hypothetical protein